MNWSIVRWIKLFGHSTTSCRSWVVAAVSQQKTPVTMRNHRNMHRVVHNLRTAIFGTKMDSAIQRIYRFADGLYVRRLSCGSSSRESRYDATCWCLRVPTFSWFCLLYCSVWTHHSVDRMYRKVICIVYVDNSSVRGFNKSSVALTLHATGFWKVTPRWGSSQRQRRERLWGLWNWHFFAMAPGASRTSTLIIVRYVYRMKLQQPNWRKINQCMLC